MDFLFESPLTIVALAAALVLACGAAWIQLGDNRILFGVVAVIVGAIGLLVLERRIVTDREAVDATILELAEHIKHNRAEAIAGMVARGTPEIAAAARSEMASHKFTDCFVTKIHKIEINAKHQPPEAIAEFNASASGSFMNGQWNQDGIQRWLRVTFWKEPDGKWRVAAYEHAEPQAFMFKKER